MQYSLSENGNLIETGDQVVTTPVNEFSRETIENMITKWDNTISDAQANKAIWTNRLAELNNLTI